MSIETIIALLAALGVGGILGALLNRRFEQQTQTNEHDIGVFKPDWSWDRGHPTPEEETIYHQYANELQNLTRKVMKQYSEYRLVVKRILKT
jgi:hypothetical protein